MACEYTKGPWKVTRSTTSAYVESSVGNGKLQEVAYCGACEFGDHEANARLIAAAPELLEATKAALAVFEAMDHDDIVCAIDLRAAIAKAEAQHDR